MVVKTLSQVRLLCVFVFLFLTVTPAKENANTALNLTKGWHLQTSAKISEKGEQISQNGYKTTNWLPVNVPTTVMGALVKNNVYKDLFMGNNLLSVDKEQFKKSWWFRTEFKLPKNGLNTTLLELNGIIYRANVWLNGKLVADSGTVFGSYRRFELNVTDFVNRAGTNVLAIEVFTAKPGEPNVGFVDWNPIPPDHNMGLWREVKIKTCGQAAVNFPFVKSKIDLEEFKSAELTVTAEVKNFSSEKIETEVTGQIEKIKFSQKVLLQPGEQKLVTFDPKDFPQLKINNPRIWWTHDYGKPELYNLKIDVTVNKKQSDVKETSFGIREVKDYFTEAGYRGYKLNGKNILIKGGGWTDDIFLRQSEDNLKAQIEYAKHLNLNTIRLEGVWGNDETLFNLCDKEGIFLMVGWSCQWEWDKLLGKKCDNHGGIITPEEIDVVSKSWRDQIKWLRNHPAVFVWAYGSDLVPRPALEQKYLDIFKEDDPTRPFLQSTAFKKSQLTGNSGVKMNGPYDYVPPIYWFTDTKNGGAFGFNTETGPGPQVPPLESIKKFIPKEHLWPIDTMWHYHCGGNVFYSLARYTEAIEKRLGKPAGLDEYLTKAQFTNYEGMRAMYEAFASNKYNATGIIQWMYNSAWPKLWWQLYDYYLMPNAAFYGAKKACEPLHAQYNPATQKVEVVNHTLNKTETLFVAISVYDFNMKPVFNRSVLTVLAPNETRALTSLAECKVSGKVYFIDLKMKDMKGKQISSNFYTLSTVPDVLDSAKTTWWVTPLKEFADFKDLNTLEKVSVNSKMKTSEAGEKVNFEITLKNPTDKLAFSIEMLITKGKSGQSVLPVFLDDNYVSLLPKEEKVIKGYVNKKDLGGKTPVLKLNGWNLK
jgi:exo-1,4-beta-D-glucosaminidase